MIKIKILTLFFFFKNLVSPVYISIENHPTKNHPKYSIRKMGKMPEKVIESSALIVNKVQHEGLKEKQSKIRYSFWTLNDSGGEPELYEVFANNDQNLQTWKINYASNYDWEELTSDDKGNIYIGDFGNNSNIRKNLKIYKTNPGDSLKTDSICFYFSDQNKFPPAKDSMNFDCEAFF